MCANGPFRKAPQYQIVQAKSGDIKGHCEREEGDDYTCTLGVASYHGKRIFKCQSPKHGICARSAHFEKGTGCVGG